MTVEQDPYWAASVAWLVTVLHGVSNDGTVRHPLPLPDALPVESVVRAADFHGVAGFARLAVDEPPPALTAVVHAGQARHLRARQDLRLVAEALDSAGVDFLVVKGPALVDTCYGGRPLRSYVDLDVAVRPVDVRRAVEALEGAGCVLRDQNWPVLTEQKVKELFVEGPSGGAIDVHWGLGGRPGTPMSVDRLLVRSVEVEDDSGFRYRTLAPADFVVEVAVHAALSGGHRLVWLTDLRGALTTATRGGAVGAVEAVAAEWGARPALGLMLRRAHDIVGVRVPPTSARFGVWPALTRMADAAAPPERVGEKGAISRLLARSCRSDQRRSLAAALGRSGAWLGRGGTEGPAHGWLHDERDPRSAFYPVGGRDARNAFFAKVARET